jgi:hypothetical protein
MRNNTNGNGNHNIKANNTKTEDDVCAYYGDYYGDY